MERSDLWWRHTFGPAKLVREVADALLYGKHPWVNYHNMPWAFEFRETIKQIVEEQDAEISFEFIDIREPDHSDPIRFLRTLDSGVMQYYMPSRALEDYIQQKELFPNTVVWAYGFSAGANETWVTLSERCAKRKTSFRIVCEGDLPVPGSGRVQRYIANKYISRFDSLLLIMSVVSEQVDYTVEQRNYLSTLLNELFELNSEAANKAVNDLDSFLTAPVTTGLQLLPECNEATVNKAVWNAQIKAIYPLIEQQRLRIIERNLKGISGILPINDNYGNTYSRPEEIELRHLVYYTASGEAFLSEADQKLLGILHPMRNKLSHLNLLDKDEVSLILSLS